MDHTLIALLVLRFIAGATATALMANFSWGFRHSIKPRQIGRVIFGPDPAPSELFGLALLTLHFKSILRLGWWDCAALVAVWLGYLPLPAAYYVSIVNAFFASLAIGGSLLAHRAMYLKIPDTLRAHYNWLTAPHYPWSKLHTESSLRAALTDEDDRVSQARHAQRNAEAERDALARAIIRDDVDMDGLQRSAAAILARI